MLLGNAFVLILAFAFFTEDGVVQDGGLYRRGRYGLMFYLQPALHGFGVWCMTFLLAVEAPPSARTGSG